MNAVYRQPSNKDNVATAAVLTASFVTIVSIMFNSTDARAETETVYKMDPIVVTAQREKVELMETIVVTASRDARVLVALK
ncbi:MAG: hypothetical protein JNN20_05805 [Betaproteobacteria bacterium]|nr:hypothetical protein [Betaproteobacteria bacterium]